MTGEKGEGGVKNPDATSMEYLLREVGDDLYLFACKREGPTIQVRFQGLPANCATGQVLFEEPRLVEAKDGNFTDWFAQYDVHVYRFKR